jgi:endonuclease/exonuclease/phosphatase family metal-dependent hydrolase
MPTLTVMTLNIGNGLAPPRRLVSFLRNSGADVIGLQELAVSQADAIASELIEAYPYQELHPRGIEGRGLLSCYPLTQVSHLQLIRDRPDLLVSVCVAGVPISVVIAHPPPPSFHWKGLRHAEETRTQVATLAELTMSSAPAVLLGDFNMTVQYALYADLVAASLVDAFHTAGHGRGNTLPTRIGYVRWLRRSLGWARLIPILRVDYIWLTPDIAVEAAWVGRDVGSDHLPVFARVTVTPEPESVEPAAGTDSSPPLGQAGS